MSSRYKLPFIVSLVFHVLIICTFICVSYFCFMSPHVQSRLSVAPHITLSPQSSEIKSTKPVTDLDWLSKRYKKQIVFDKKFKASDDLTGYVVHLVSQPDKQSIIYTDQKHRYVIMGSLIDRDHGNVTLNDSERYLQRKNDERVGSTLEKCQGIVQGRKKSPLVTIVIDPNSHWFPIMYKNLLTDVDEGMFSIKWVLINYLKPDGPNVANDIMRSSTPLVALAINANRYNALFQTGGYVKDLAETQYTKRILRQRWDIIQAHSLYELPISVFRAKGRVHVITGLITDEMLEQYFS